MADRCPECRGTGFSLRTDENGVTTAVACTCRSNDRGDALRKYARFPRRYLHCDFADFRPTDPSQAAALEVARTWSDEWPMNSSGLLFVGPPGTGKTHLAVALARALLDRMQVRVLFYEQRELLKALQGTFDSGALQREAEILGPVLDAELLVLDDLGAGRTTPWAKDVLHDIIVHRYNEQAPLIMTSNLALGDDDDNRSRRPRGPEAPLSLGDRLGDALMSRLYEMCRIVPVRGEDFRSKVLHAKHKY